MGKIIDKILKLKDRYLTNEQFMVLVALIVGITVGFSAVIIKNSVFLIQSLVLSDFFQQYNYIYFVFPLIGISIVVVFMRYILRQPVGHGIPDVLYSIAETRGYVKKHNMFSSIITSAITVGFGGSVGLEGPSVSTGGAYGSFIGHAFKLTYKQVILMLGAASASALAAIFKAPMTGIVFAMEVIMIDLTVASIVPLIVASVAAVFTSYFFMGNEVLYHFKLTEMYTFSELPFFALLGIFTGLISVYFTKVYIGTNQVFRRIKSWGLRLLISGFMLGLLIFLFPALYGEGYEVINKVLIGDTDLMLSSSIFDIFSDNSWAVIVLVFAILMLKTWATSFTITAGGVGGTFAPTLFNGALAGLFFALVLNQFGFSLPITNFALTGMAGAVAGVLLAPLTAIFLIAEISGGYELLPPLMLVSLMSYLTSKIFIPRSIYTYQLAQKGQLMTHNADSNILKMMDVKSLLECNFEKLNPNQKLKDLVNAIQVSNRNIFPVVDEEDRFLGMVMMEDIRKIIFKQHLYNTTLVKELMIRPEVTIKQEETMNSIASKLHKTSMYNIPVLDETGKYLGFVSRANVFSEYRKLLQDFSTE